MLLVFIRPDFVAHPTSYQDQNCVPVKGSLFFLVNLFIFGSAGSSLLHTAFSRCSEQGLESSQTRDRIHVPCIGSGILNHREVPVRVLCFLSCVKVKTSPCILFMLTVEFSSTCGLQVSS